MQMDITIAFFILGALATLVKANIQFPKALYQGLTLFLLIAIGIKGGVALAEHGSAKLLPQSGLVILLGLAIPLIAFPILRFIGQLNREDSASIAAHYGSVSIGTYAVAVAFLETQNIAYEAYFPLFVVLLEVPAIAVGIALAKKTGDKVKWRVLLHEVFCNQSTAKSRQLGVLQQAIRQELIKRKNPHLKVIITPALWESFKNLEWARIDEDSLLSGFLSNLFLWGASDEAQLKALNKRATMVRSGDTAVSDADAQEILKVKVNLPMENQSIDNLCRLDVG